MGTKHFLIILTLILLFSCKQQQQAGISLTLIPPTTITNKVKLDIRAGIRNTEKSDKKLNVLFYLNEETSQNLLFETTIELAPNSTECVKFMMPTADKAGVNNILLVVKEGGKKQKLQKKIEIINSDIRSTRTIDGAWLGLYHWSEEEGKLWNSDIKKVTDEQWKEVVGSMNKIKMDIIILQEVFRNQQYVGKHNIEKDGYQGKAFYPSNLYSERMPITAKDPVEAILSSADEHGMHVFMGVGVYAWFDFTTASLEWHKNVAKELWDKYGHHPSFYGWYVSDESPGSLDGFETTVEKQLIRKKEIVAFFKGFKEFCNKLAPDKPIMLATNCFAVPAGESTYPALLENLDIICPFGFARMPKGDITGEQAAKLLQRLCEESNSHLWFDLEAFLFNKDGNLYPRPMEAIAQDLTLFDNFEKTLCYQFPGMFNDPNASIRIGNEESIKLFSDYQKYLEKIERHWGKQ
jgi:hypothetical protein